MWCHPSLYVVGELFLRQLGFDLPVIFQWYIANYAGHTQYSIQNTSTKQFLVYKDNKLSLSDDSSFRWYIWHKDAQDYYQFVCLVFVVDDLC